MTARLFIVAAILLLPALPAAAFDQAALTALENNGGCVDCDLSGVDLQGTDLPGAELDGANLSGADLSWSDLMGVLLRGANLSGANLEHADLTAADLRGADLTGARLTNATVENADFSGAILTNADITGVDFSSTIGADLTAAIDQTPKPVPTNPHSKGALNLYVGSVFLVSFGYCPSGTLEADGRSLPIADYQIPYALLQGAFGYDATSFQLPDLRQQVPLKGLRFCVVVDGLWPARP